MGTFDNFPKRGDHVEVDIGKVREDWQIGHVYSTSMFEGFIEVLMLETPTHKSFIVRRDLSSEGLNWRRL